MGSIYFPQTTELWLAVNRWLGALGNGNYWPFVKGIHRQPMDSLNRRSVMRKVEDFFVVCLKKLLNKHLRCRDLRRYNIHVTSLWFKTIVSVLRCHLPFNLARIVRLRCFLCYIYLISLSISISVTIFCESMPIFLYAMIWTSTGIDADASKGETSPGYFNSKLVYSYRCGTIFPWEFPEISLAYSHIFMKGPSRSIIYGQIFWHPHPHPHIASPACIYHQNQLSFAFRFSFHLTIHFENAGNICNKIDL